MDICLVCGTDVRTDDQTVGLKRERVRMVECFIYYRDELLDINE